MVFDGAIGDADPVLRNTLGLRRVGKLAAEITERERTGFASKFGGETRACIDISGVHRKVLVGSVRRRGGRTRETPFRPRREDARRRSRRRTTRQSRSR